MMWLYCCVASRWDNSSGQPRKPQHSPIINGNLRNAIIEWLLDASRAEVVFGHISKWDTSSLTDMRDLFEGITMAPRFNEDLSSWDVSSVTDMSHCFEGASSFNSDLSTWRVHNVRDMSAMFKGAAAFNSNLSAWDTSNVFKFREMFSGATSFNGDINNWDISHSEDLSFMFKDAMAFNGNLSQWTNDVDPAKASGIFSVKWAQKMSHMFQGASSFEGLGLQMWDTSAVIDMNSMFKGAVKFNTDISPWRVGLVRDFSEMFSGSAFNRSLCWQIKSGVAISHMFEGTNGSMMVDSDCQHHEQESLWVDAETASGRPSATSFLLSSTFGLVLLFFCVAVFLALLLKWQAGAQTQTLRRSSSTVHLV